jgi:NAD(P)-dependent dehydrogenase (short-subunit alcohol dehydrogenase family)
MDLGLDGARVLVTGGSDGLGLALGARLVAEGARVAICGRDRDRLEAARAQLAAGGGDVLAVRCDVSDAADLAALVEQVLAAFGGLEGLVSNAGRSAAMTLLETTDEVWEEDLSLKLHAAVRLARLCVPALAESGRGSIVNVLAIKAKTPDAGSMPTSVSRAAGLALTKALSKELGPLGIRANALLIGLIESGQWQRRAVDAGVAVEELYASMADGNDIPLGRVGRAEEFADVAAFLLSARAGYVTGVGLNLDGGLSPAW